MLFEQLSEAAANEADAARALAYMGTLKRLYRYHPSVNKRREWEAAFRVLRVKDKWSPSDINFVLKLADLGYGTPKTPSAFREYFAEVRERYMTTCFAYAVDPCQGLGTLSDDALHWADLFCWLGSTNPDQNVAALSAQLQLLRQVWPEAKWGLAARWLRCRQAYHEAKQFTVPIVHRQVYLIPGEPLIFDQALRAVFDDTQIRTLKKWHST